MMTLHADTDDFPVPLRWEARRRIYDAADRAAEEMHKHRLLCMAQVQAAFQAGAQTPPSPKRGET